MSIAVGYHSGKCLSQTAGIFSAQGALLLLLPPRDYQDSGASSLPNPVCKYAHRHDVSSTGQTVYLEPVEALHLNNEIRQYEAEEQQEIERILMELTNHIRENRKFLHQNIETLAELDVIAAKAKVSIQLDGEIPTISHTGFMF